MRNLSRFLPTLVQVIFAAVFLSVLKTSAVLGEPIRHYAIEAAILDAEFDRATWLLDETTDQEQPRILFLKGLVKTLEYSPHHDFDDAVRLLRLSAGKGSDEAHLLLGFLTLESDDESLKEEGLEHFLSAEDSFPGLAALGRATILMSLNRDHSEISRLAEIAHGHKARLSSALLGTVYWGGIGRERDLSKARYHLGGDAKEGFSFSQLILGQILIRDACASQTTAVSPNALENGLKWITVASLQGYSIASEYLKDCEDRFGKEVLEKALLDARQWFTKRKQHVHSDIALAMEWCEKDDNDSSDCEHLSFEHDLECMAPLSTVFSGHEYRETGIYAACRRHYLSTPH